MTEGEKGDLKLWIKHHKLVGRWHASLVLGIFSWVEDTVRGVDIGGDGADYLEEFLHFQELARHGECNGS